MRLTGDLLGPDGARQLTLARLRASGDSVSFQMFPPELGTLSTVTRSFLVRDQRHHIDDCWFLYRLWARYISSLAPIDPSSAPEPATVMLLGAGLVGVVVAKKARRS